MTPIFAILLAAGADEPPAAAGVLSARVPQPASAAVAPREITPARACLRLIMILLVMVAAMPRHWAK